MTFSESGLLRAMKQQYKGYGYTVAQTENGLLICCDTWGVGIRDHLVPNKVKGLIVTRAGKLPDQGCALYCHKDCISTKLYDMVVDRVRTLMAKDAQDAVLPTRLSMDGMMIWQDIKTLRIYLVDPEDQQVCDVDDLEVWEVDDALFAQNVSGVVYVECKRQPEMKSKIHHLEQMQWAFANEEG